MAEKKRKTIDEHRSKQDGGKRMMRKHSNLSRKSIKNSKGGEERMRKGPSLPNALRKELEILNPTNADGSNSDDDINSYDANDLYEYEEVFPEEESKKNRRYDPVEYRRYKFSEDKNEDIGSDEWDIEEDDDDDVDGSRGDQKGDEIEEEDEGRHARMLEGITGLPGDAFEAV